MLKIRLAAPENAEEVMSLYSSLVGSPGLPWDENYPNIDLVNGDIENNSLYIAVSDGEIIAAMGAGNDEETVDLTDMKNPCELYRVGVKREYQRRGIAGKLLEYIKIDAEKRGFDGMFLLAAKGNVPAVRLYEKHGFKRNGEAALWGHEYWRYELYF